MSNVSNLFDKNKTKYIENNRFNNIKIKTNKFINVNTNTLQQDNTNRLLFNKYYKTKLNFYNFNNFKTSNIINLDTTRENEENKINKITMKNILIPSYSNNEIFDLKNIYQNTSKIINEQNVNNSNNMNDLENIALLKRKKINKIYHIYQEKYISDEINTGFGDFIRSCFFITQFCKMYDFNCQIIINHPIAYFLKNHTYFDENNYESKILFKTVSKFSENNWNHCLYDEENYIKDFSISNSQLSNFIKYLGSLNIVNNSILTYNIFFPYNNISNEECLNVSSILEPNNELQIYIDNTIQNLGFTKKNYIVIHIRSGDNYLIHNKNTFNNAYINTLKYEIYKIVYKNTNMKFLIISDNNDIKHILKDIFFNYNFSFLFNEITHIGEKVILKKDKIKNTLLDFYLMSSSSYIYSITSYQHGSGFSYWCSKVYNIPYKCKYIPNVK